MELNPYNSPNRARWHTPSDGHTRMRREKKKELGLPDVLPAELVPAELKTPYSPYYDSIKPKKCPMYMWRNSASVGFGYAQCSNGLWDKTHCYQHAPENARVRQAPIKPSFWQRWFSKPVKLAKMKQGKKTHLMANGYFTWCSKSEPLFHPIVFTGPSGRVDCRDCLAKSKAKDYQRWWDDSHRADLARGIEESPEQPPFYPPKRQAHFERNYEDLPQS
jgi:hypothetical protein